MAFNLQRDAKIYVSEVSTGFTTSNTFEVRPMAGFTFNQKTNTQDVSVDEAGATPSRGVKRFNTSLAPTDISFDTYIRPYKDVSANHTCVERILWEAFVGNGSVGTNTTSNSTKLTIDFDGSNVHELKKLYFFIDYGNAKYRVDEGVVGQAVIGFDLQGIATIKWTGNGKIINEVTEVSSGTFPTTGKFTPIEDCADFIKNKLSTISLVDTSAKTRGYQDISFSTTPGGTVTSSTAVLGSSTSTYTFTVAIDGGTAQTITYTADGTTTMNDIVTAIESQLVCGTILVNYSAKYIRIYSDTVGTSSSVLITDAVSNGLIAAVGFDPGIQAAVAGTSVSRTYNIPITGGSITLNNNVTFLTPEELGVVNKSIGHFTGVRSITGNVTAYLRSGSSTDASQLMEDMLNATDETTNSYALTISIGGSTNTPRVDLIMPTAHLSIPTIDTQDVISTTIDFAAVPTDLGNTDELTIEYRAS